MRVNRLRWEITFADDSNEIALAEVSFLGYSLYVERQEWDCEIEYTGGIKEAQNAVSVYSTVGRDAKEVRINLEKHLFGVLIPAALGVDTVHSILKWFSLAKPNPSIKDIATQIGCHIEEFSEMCAALGIPQDLIGILETQEAKFKEHNDGTLLFNRVDLLDSLCDQIVTALGVGYMAGFDMEEALARVNKSNWSKFVDGTPIVGQYGKIEKGPYYEKPRLQDLA